MSIELERKSKVSLDDAIREAYSTFHIPLDHYLSTDHDKREPFGELVRDLSGEKTSTDMIMKRTLAMRKKKGQLPKLGEKGFTSPKQPK